MKLSYKKGKLGKALGQKTSSKKTYGNKAQNVSLSEAQFTRLMENFVLEQEESAAFYDVIEKDTVDEEFGDGDYRGDANFDTENFNNPIDLDEDDVIGTGDTGASDEDGAPESEKGLKKFDDDELFEDSEGEETYHYDKDLHHDKGELHHLEGERDHSSGSQKQGLDQHIAALMNSMKYDEKRGVGKDDKYRREPGEHFFHSGNGLAESKKISKRQKSRLLNEAKHELNKRNSRLLSESKREFRRRGL